MGSQDERLFSSDHIYLEPPSCSSIPTIPGFRDTSNLAVTAKPFSHVERQHGTLSRLDLIHIAWSLRVYYIKKAFIKKYTNKKESYELVQVDSKLSPF